MRKVKVNQMIYELHYKIKIILNNFKSKLLFAQVGKRTYIFKPLRVVGAKHIYWGSYTSAMPGLRIEAIEYHNSKKYSPNIYIGDRVNIEQNVHITCADRITIGNDCSILADVLITDINHPYENILCPPREANFETKPVSIGEQTMIGMGAKIMPGVSIGKHCVVGTNAVVTKNIDDYCVVAGIPAKVIKKYDVEKQKWITIDKENHFWIIYIYV